MGSGTGRRKLQSARAPGPSRQTRTRTRQNRGALITDPAQSTALLTSQLHSLGLYAANILGDGNCLFRALADQYYGSPSKHLELRGEICEWIARNRERYAPFVDDERGLDVHLGCMRRPGTYGGHLELSAFAHLKKRNVKVIQPGLVYVIEWSAGGDDDEDEDDVDDVNKAEGDAEAESDEDIKHGRHEVEDGDAVMTNGGAAVLGVSSRELRKLRREKLRRNKQKDAARALRDAGDEGVLAAQGTVYVAYHDWEHFSSVRNLTGPHAGLPCVMERPQPGLIDGGGGDPDAEEREQERERERRRDERTTKKKRDKPVSKVSVNGHGDAMDVVSESPMTTRPTMPMPMPTDIPLPPSRSLSPAVSSETSTSMSSGPGGTPYPHIHSSQTAYLQTGSHPAQSGHSPLANGHTTSAQTSGSDSSSTQPHPSHTYSHPHAHSNPALPKLVLRIDRSPKRSFDESEGESGAGGGGGRSGQGRGERDGRVRRDGGDLKRTRVRRGGDRDEGHVGVIVVDDEEEEEEGEAASDSSAVSASQSSTPSSSSSHSRSSSPSSSPPHQHTHARTPPRTRSHLHAGTSKTRVVIVPPSPASHLPPSHPLATSTSKTHNKLTKRQRKVLGLPKERVVGAVGSSSVASRTRSRSTGLAVPGAMVNGSAGVGKIVIPGGKFRGGDGGGGRVSGAEGGSGGGGGETEEWRVNGAGRLDVRGFRELKI